MGFHWWSIPVFLTVAVIGYGIVVAASWSVRKVPRIIVVSVSAVIMGATCLFGWWLNQGDTNDIGQELFLADWVILLIEVVLFVAISLILSRYMPKRQASCPNPQGRS